MPNKMEPKVKEYGNCLKCGQSFIKESKYNRLCDKCHAVNAGLSKMHTTRIDYCTIMGARKCTTEII